MLTRSTNSADTENLAKQIGRNLVGGEVIDLVSDLGGGKTTFVKGLVCGLGSKDTVTSPTYTISNVYHSPSLRLYHFDFYRLADPGLQSHELAEVIGNKESVVAVEWSGVVGKVLPNHRLTVRIQALSPNKRKITLSYPARLEYLIKGLNA